MEKEELTHAEEKKLRSERKRKSREERKNMAKKKARRKPGAWAQRHLDTEKRVKRRELQRAREREQRLDALGEP